ncbi:MAG: thioredoxin domain-containing protein [Candidatus Micrarchaeota archaeon]|nr:thioredoxin domain-containing protein [Candidatus Micrarchaeota archaeon]
MEKASAFFTGQNGENVSEGSKAPKNEDELDKYIQGLRQRGAGQTESGKPNEYLLVKFETPWCGPCKRMGMDAQAIADDNNKPYVFSYLALDIEKTPDYTLSKEMNVDNMPGNRIDRLTGDLKNSLEALLGRVYTGIGDDGKKTALLDMKSSGMQQKINEAVENAGKLKVGAQHQFTLDKEKYFNITKDENGYCLNAATFFYNKNGKSYGVPIWAIYQNGVRVDQGEGYDGTLRFKLDFIEKNGRLPTKEEISSYKRKNEGHGIIQVQGKPLTH